MYLIQTSKERQVYLFPYLSIISIYLLFSFLFPLFLIFRFLLFEKVPLFFGEENKSILNSMIHVIGKSSSEDITKMGEGLFRFVWVSFIHSFYPSSNQLPFLLLLLLDCKMDSEGLELIRSIDQLSPEQSQIKYPLKDVRLFLPLLSSSLTLSSYSLSIS